MSTSESMTKEPTVDGPVQPTNNEDPMFGSQVEENPEQRVTDQVNLEYCRLPTVT
jgi:hypothetical protein